MKDKETKFEEIETSLTLGGAVIHTQIRQFPRTQADYASLGCDNRYTFCVQALVSLMKDKETKHEEIETSHTLGGAVIHTQIRQSRVSRTDSRIFQLFIINR